jgi:16S rRNA (cytidine1402-2'-O)-methyltransferase
MAKVDPGTLYIVATPIGNLEDITLRALDVLRGVDVVVCEDTRHTRKLLTRHGIDARTRSCHKFNEKRRTQEVLELLSQGRSVALVSDAGTPSISDPGAEVAAQAAEAGYAVVPIPGASAPTALLSVAGLGADRHMFLGFPPHRAEERRRWLEELAGRQETLVLLESPHRIAATLVDLAAALGAERRAVIGRELTKLHEELIRGTLGEIAAGMAAGPGRGEYTVAIEGASRAAGTLPGGSLVDQVRLVEERLGLDRKEAMRYVARELGISRREVYARLLQEGDD